MELHGRLDWTGPLPAYKYFEPKRTSPTDYEEMIKEFKDKNWSFLEVSRKYIQGDVIALHQILMKFFKELAAQFPINPLENLSIPGIAFKTWRTVKLPKLHEVDLKVYYLSKSLDPVFRKGYAGGIVDVYKPHLKGIGYYYDVNSLYPTAMCKPMPVGIPTPTNFTMN